MPTLQNPETGRLNKIQRLQSLLQEPRKSTFERHEIVRIVTALRTLESERDALWLAKPTTSSPVAYWVKRK